MTLSDDARNFNWMLDHFVEETAGVTDSVAVSSDGLLMAASRSLDREGLEQLIVAMRKGYLFVSAISDGSCLGVVATRSCDIGLVGYQTALLVERAGDVLTPELVRTLK